MPERFIKVEGGKKLLCERDTSIMGFLSPERVIGEIKEKPFTSGGERLELVHRGLTGRREDVREVHTGLSTNDRPLPLMRKNDYEVKKGDGSVERYSHNSFRKTFERNGGSPAPQDPPLQSRERKSGHSSVLRSSYGSGGATSVGDTRWRGERSALPESSQGRHDERENKQKKKDGASGLLVLGLGLGVTFLACGVLESLSHPRSTVALPERKEYRPEPPPAIRSGTLWWGFISFLGIFIGSFIFGHALFVFDGPWAYRLIEAIFAVLVLLPSRDFLLDSAESRKISLEIHAESEIRRREVWERQQDKKFGPRSA